MIKNNTKALWEQHRKIFNFSSSDSLSPPPQSPALAHCSSSHLLFPPQWNLSAGPQAAGHLLPAAAVPEGDQRRQRAHRREQPALLLQHRQLDPTLPHLQPEGPDPQQPEPQAVL